MTQTLETLDVGQHADVPSDVYHSLPRASASRLCTLARSAAHLREEMLNPTEPTPALVLGTAIHVAVLESAEFEKRYAVAPKFDRRTNAGKATFQAFTDSLDGKIVLTDDQFWTCAKVAKSVAHHPAASYLLSSRKATELTALWRDPATGVACKLRADAVCAPDDYGETLVDLKSTDDASERGFWKAVDAYRYDLRAAFYQRGLAMVGRPVEDVVFIMVEKSPPFCVGVYTMPAALMKIADRRIDALLATYAECERTGEWPGYQPFIMKFGQPEEMNLPQIPPWLLKRRLEEAPDAANN